MFQPTMFQFVIHSPLSRLLNYSMTGDCKIPALSIIFKMVVEQLRMWSKITNTHLNLT